MYDDIKSSLKETYNNYAFEREKNEMQEWKTKPRQIFLDMLKKQDKNTLLEIGAGHGRDSRFFMDNGLQVTAVDLSNEMVKLCKGKGIEAYELDFYNISSLGRTFDAVWAMNCLLHVEKKDLDFVLHEIDSVLNSSGLFFMGVYGGIDQEGIWENDFYTPKRFYSFYSDENILRIVKKHFTVIDFQMIETERELHFQSIIMRKK